MDIPIFCENVEENTIRNDLYRFVRYTTSNMQFVYMSIPVKGYVPEEVHNVDQFIRVEKGFGFAIVNDTTYQLSDGMAIIIPAGSKHYIGNSGSEPLKLYTIYSPSEHDPYQIDLNQDEF